MKGLRRRHGRSGASAGDTPRWRFTLDNGSTVTGVVQGSGGFIRGPATRLTRAIRLARQGRDTGLYEPRPGCLAVYPHFSAASDGPMTTVDLRHVTGVRVA